MKGCLRLSIANKRFYLRTIKLLEKLQGEVGIIPKEQDDELITVERGYRALHL